MGQLGGVHGCIEVAAGNARSWRACGVCGLEDELLACLVDGRCAQESVGAGDTEVGHYALDRAGQVAGSG